MREIADKYHFSFTPTPLHQVRSLGDQLGVELWFKRDDLTGCVATGGNKIRKLEYLLRDAVKQGADCVMTSGGPQSNHAKATVALAIKAKLKPILVLAGDDPGKRQANLFIDQLLGADIRFSGAKAPSDIEAALQREVELEKEKGNKPYFIPIGGSNGIGSLGYVDAYQELGSEKFDTIVITAGSGGTYAGLYYALADAGRLPSQQQEGGTRLLGFSPWVSKAEIKERVLFCLEELHVLKASPRFSLEQAKQDLEHWLDDQYIGPGYGKMTAEAREAIELTASQEAILLDHVYTGKAMAGLIDYIRQGKITQQEKVLFWHTGGAPGLFAIQDEWQG